MLFLATPMVLVVALFNSEISLFFNNAKPVYELVTEVDNSNINAKTVLLGDSVCRQFYEANKTEELFCLCENQSYEVAGNYILLNMLLKNGANFKELVLMVNPETLTYALNQDYTYNYFVKPFRKKLNYLSENEQEYIKKAFPESDVLKYKFSNYKIEDSLKTRGRNSQDSLEFSKINLKYIEKIKLLCKQNNIAFRMRCPPLPNSSKSYIERFTTRTKKTFGTYFESVLYYDVKESKDGVHHRAPESYIEKNSKRLDDLVRS